MGLVENYSVNFRIIRRYKDEGENGSYKVKTEVVHPFFPQGDSLWCVDLAQMDKFGSLVLPPGLMDGSGLSEDEILGLVLNNDLTSLLRRQGYARFGRWGHYLDSSAAKVDVVIRDDPAVSREHGRIYVHENGGLACDDISENGSRVTDCRNRTVNTKRGDTAILFPHDFDERKGTATISFGSYVVAPIANAERPPWLASLFASLCAGGKEAPPDIHANDLVINLSRQPK